MKSPTLLLSLLWSFCYMWTAEAQLAFTVPDGETADLDESLTIVQNTIAQFVWLANTTYQPTLDGSQILDNSGDISLWLTSFATHDFGICLSASVYSSTGGSWAYNVSLTDDEIDNNQGEFVYRLYSPVASTSTPYKDTDSQIPSRGFYIRKASDVAASSASAAASQAASRSKAAAASKSEAATASTTQSAATTTQTGTQTGSVSTTATTNAAQNTSGAADPTPTPSSGLSTGAKAGIAIGVVALALIAALAIFLVLRRRRSKPNPTAELAANHGAHDKTVYAHHAGNGAPQYPQGYASPPSEMEAPMQAQHAYELPGNQAAKP